MVYGGPEKPPVGASTKGGGAGLPGEPGGCPALFFARGFLILVSLFPRARARNRPQALCLQGFRGVRQPASIPTFSGSHPTFSGLVLHFPGAIHRHNKNYPQDDQVTRLYLKIYI
jgi:hypothetical protein